MKTKVCILTTTHQPCDTRVFHKEAKSLAKVHDAVLIAPDEGSADKEVDGVRIITVKKPRSKVLHPITMWRVFKAGFKQDCDVYHCHEPGSLFVCAILKVLRGKKLIYGNRLNNLWQEPQDYTDFHKISMLILNLVILYDIHTILRKYIYDAHEHYPSLIAGDSLFPDFIRPHVRFFADVEESALNEVIS